LLLALPFTGFLRDWAAIKLYGWGNFTLDCLAFNPFSAPKSWGNLAWAGGAVLALTSTPQLLVFLPIAIPYTIGLLCLEWKKGTLKLKLTLLQLLFAAALALALSAFFLIPATFEINQVTLKFAKAGLEDDSRFWSKITGLLDLWHPVNTYSGVVLVGLIGTLPLWLALVGLIILVFQRPELRWLWGLLGLISALTIFLQLPISRFFWETFSDLIAVQFTSRLMYTATIFLAPLVGGFALLKIGKHTRLPATIGGVVTCGLLVFACFNNYGCPYWPLTFDGAISQKTLTEQIGNGDVMYLPKSVDGVASVSRYFPPTFGDDRATSNTDSLNWQLDGAGVYHLTATLSQPGSVSLPIFWLKDWWKIQDQNGREYLSKATPETEHVSLELAAGQYQLEVRVEDNPLKFISNWVSILAVTSLLLFLGLLPILSRKRTISIKDYLL